MTMTSFSNADLLALATEALQHEGVAAYFPGLDPETFDAPAALAAAMKAQPTAWEAPSEDGPWECAIDERDLLAAARALGAQRAVTYTTVTGGLCYHHAGRLAEFAVAGSLPTHAQWTVSRGEMSGIDGERWVSDAVKAARGRAAAELGCGEDAIDLIEARGFEVGADTDEPELSIEFLRVEDLDA